MSERVFPELGVVTTVLQARTHAASKPISFEEAVEVYYLVPEEEPATKSSNLNPEETSMTDVPNIPEEKNEGLNVKRLVFAIVGGVAIYFIPNLVDRFFDNVTVAKDGSVTPTQD